MKTSRLSLVVAAAVVATAAVVLALVVVCPATIAGVEAHDHHAHDHHHHDHHGHKPHHHFYHKETYENDDGHHHHHHHHEHDHEHHHSHDDAAEKAASVAKPSAFNDAMRLLIDVDVDFENWARALGSTFLISAIPALTLLFIKVDLASPSVQSFLKVLLAFAAGGLLGDAFLHLIPHASHHDHHHHDHHDHDHDHDHHHHDHHGHDHGHDHDVLAELTPGLCILTGMFVFLVIEKFVRSVKGGHGHGHGHGHSHDAPTVQQSKKDTGAKTKKETSSSKTPEKAGNDAASGARKEIAISGYLNLAADFAHNFTDGLAIGACFASNDSIAFATVVTILLHEFPHEIGDFAILVQSGCSKMKAIKLQLVTALGAFMGTAVGMISSELDGATPYVLLFTAGGFIYIAAVTVIPELLEASTLWQTMKELGAMVVGVLIMVGISFLEH